MRSSVRLYGVGSVRKRLRSRSMRHKAVALPSLVEGAKFLLEKSLEIVPRRTGALAESGHVVKGGYVLNWWADVVYTAPYAIYQHENLQYNHQPGQSAKYLEIPALMYRNEIRATINAGIEKRLR